ncbi:hypothetical protein [Gimesia sp.]|uniref:hypothetical protein n=1 Tax=Gimesia sp. TaxID=2024833 RepID=UPI000C5BA9BD|nr:hypothetical protein [Gimesia sp.]MAX40968.1 hypothetical protein [Gimesia sp.]HAH46838.1 hypothetical protein [Planctomycetaceae bacterium]HBL42751.1 hypothetical protein [Planctomycetaceae bacterium]|tara:strand:- start:97 stop:651 length:555 start_codon:yes stop_codon:yes gene_type:complete
MSQSLKIHVPAERDFYSDETKKALAPLVKEIASHNKKVDTHEAARARVESGNIESISSKDLFEGPASNTYRFDLYGKAIELCDKVKEFSSLHAADHKARYRGIVDELDTWRLRIREELTKLGYVEEELHPGHVNQVNNIYRCHPEALKLIHMEGNYRQTDYLKGGDRAALVAGMDRLRKQCLAT